MQSTILNILQDSRLCLSTGLCSELVVSRIDQYLQLLVKWNRKINLTAQKDSQQILSRHVFDSLQYLRVIEPGTRVMDIGSGAGFPGLPLKIIYPDLDLVLVESLRKRCSFLETAVRDMSLKNVEVINLRAEQVGDEYAGQFDAVVLRAVTCVEACLHLASRFVGPLGVVILKKSPEEELKAVYTESGFELQKDVPITSFHGLASNLLVFQKCFT